MSVRGGTVRAEPDRHSNDDERHATAAGMAAHRVFADLPLFVRRSTGRSAWNTGQTDRAQNGSARTGRRDAWTNSALLRPTTRNVTDSRRAVRALASRGHDRGTARNARSRQCARRRTLRAVQFDHRGNRRAVSRCARQEEAACVNLHPTSHRGIAMTPSHRGPFRRRATLHPSRTE